MGKTYVEITSRGVTLGASLDCEPESSPLSMSFCERTLCGSVAFGTSTCNMSTLACQQKKDFTYLSLTFVFFDKHLASRSAVKVPFFPGFKKKSTRTFPLQLKATLIFCPGLAFSLSMHFGDDIMCL